MWTGSQFTKGITVFWELKCDANIFLKPHTFRYKRMHTCKCVKIYSLQKYHRIKCCGPSFHNMSNGWLAALLDIISKYKAIFSWQRLWRRHHPLNYAVVVLAKSFLRCLLCVSVQRFTWMLNEPNINARQCECQFSGWKWPLYLHGLEIMKTNYHRLVLSHAKIWTTDVEQNYVERDLNAIQKQSSFKG